MHDIERKKAAYKKAEEFGFTTDEARSAVYVREEIVGVFDLLSQYDNNSVTPPSPYGAEEMMHIGKLIITDERELAKSGVEFYILESENAYKFVEFVKWAFPENRVFGIESEPSKLSGIIASVYQSVGGADAYPTPLAKAVNLLYFVIKNHPFCDGNKRIATFLFCMFMEMHAPGIVEEKVGYAVLPAVALLIVFSKPQDKDLVINFVMRLFQPLE